MSNENTGNVMVEASAASASIPRYRFVIPDGARSRDTDPQSVVLQELTVSQEQAASRLGKEGALLGYELLKQSLVMVNDRPVTWKGGEKDRVIEGSSPRVRQLLLQAYGAVHSVADKDEKDFLASMSVQG